MCGILEAGISIFHIARYGLTEVIDSMGLLAATPQCSLRLMVGV
jgi:hypothetical protein